VCVCVCVCVCGTGDQTQDLVSGKQPLNVHPQPLVFCFFGVFLKFIFVCLFVFAF
jgi:hypothetical protein